MIHPNNEPVRPIDYMAEIARTSLRHRRALTLTLVCVALIGIFTFVVLPKHAMVILPAAVAAAILFEAAIATWRLYQTKSNALDLMRLLLDIDAADRDLFERHLEETHRWREERLHAQNADRVQRLFDEITLLQATLDARRP